MKETNPRYLSHFWSSTFRQLQQSVLRGLALAFLICLGVFPGEFAQAQDRQATQAEKPSVETADSLPFDRAQYLSAFTQVWETVRDTHWDPKLIESVWVPAREKFLPQMEQAQTRQEATKVLADMLLELKQSHFAILPAEIYAATDQMEMQGGEGWSGLTLKSLEDQFVITKVAPDSPASEAGIEVGWVVEEVRPAVIDKPLSARKIRELAGKLSLKLGMRLETSLSIVSTQLTTGEIGQSVEIKLLDNLDTQRTIQLQLAKGPGVAAKFGNFPTTYVNFEYRQLPGEVGYIGFNAFFDAPRLIKEYQAALLDKHNARGIVIDLRGNPGGMILLVQGMSGWFVDDVCNLGSMRYKANTLQLSINPRKPRFDKPVAILVDECSVSSAELFPGGLQELGVARVFGSRTAGQVIPSQVVKLPTGDGFQYALAGLESTSGFSWEGNGVQPDEPVTLTRKLLQQDPDPVLTAALNWIAQSKSE